MSTVCRHLASGSKSDWLIVMIDTQAVVFCPRNQLTAAKTQACYAFLDTPKLKRIDMYFTIISHQCLYVMPDKNC
jgi:hypothetical protein